LIVVRAEVSFYSNSIEYMALGDNFETEEGKPTTYYNASIRYDIIETETGKDCGDLVFEGFLKA
jgi:hypothetical protein